MQKTDLGINFIYLGNKEIYCIFKTYCIISVFSPHKMLFYGMSDNIMTLYSL